MRFAGLASIVLLTSLLGSRARAQLDRGRHAHLVVSSCDAGAGRRRAGTNRAPADDLAGRPRPEPRRRREPGAGGCGRGARPGGVAASRSRAQVRAMGCAALASVRARQRADADARRAPDVSGLGDPRCARASGGRRSRQRARYVAGAPAGGRRAGQADLRDLLQGRPGAAAASRARRPDLARPGAGPPQSADRPRQPAGRSSPGARDDPPAHRRGAHRAGAAVEPGAAERAHGPAGRGAARATGGSRRHPRGARSRRSKRASTRIGRRSAWPPAPCAAARRCWTKREARRDSRRSWWVSTTGTCRPSRTFTRPTAPWSASICPGSPAATGTRSARRNRRSTPRRHALESAQNAVRYELHDAAARLESARQSFTIIDQELLAQARRSLEATQAEYAAGHGDAVGLLDALRSYLQVRIERVRALAELASSQADLERAAGTLAVEGATR